jgi:hypothetical protein
MLAVLLVVLAQAGLCTPADTSAVCDCKMGKAGACELLMQMDPLVAAELEKTAAQAALLEAARREQEAKASAAQSQETSAAPEPPDCKGQQHHIISRTIAKALERHDTLKGLYQARDPRFVSQAKDEQSHCGYQDWHRKVDQEVVEWLARTRRATQKEFEDYLRSIYNRPEMRERFPRGF